MTTPFDTYEALLAKGSVARPRTDVLRELHTAVESREFGVALDLAQNLVDADAEDAEAIAIHAWASVRGGEANDDELREALGNMEKAVSADRSCAQAVFYRGLMHKRLGDVPSAFRDFAKAMQLNPEHTAAETEVKAFAMRTRKLRSGEHVLNLGKAFGPKK